ncbi:hypothetical protein CW304_22005 [Bacillus sp. UFRGS-B20]|nr:hypothetical protein CW304_22005 [Bacillus sp. UFRGS-B20]
MFTCVRKSFVFVNITACYNVRPIFLRSFLVSSGVFGLHISLDLSVVLPQPPAHFTIYFTAIYTAVRSPSALPIICGSNSFPFFCWYFFVFFSLHDT